MLSISVVVLLSSVAWVHAEDFIDNLAFGDKLADRAFMAWSLQHALLEDTMHAKPAGAKLAVLSVEPTSPCKSPFKKVPLGQASVPWGSPLLVPRTPGATVHQVDPIPVEERLPAGKAACQKMGRWAGRLAGRLAGKWAGSFEYLAPRAGFQSLAPIAGITPLEATPEELQAAISIAGLTPPETPRQKAETRSVNDDVDAAEASAKEGSRYFGRLAPLSGVLPEMMTPNEAASVSIAGLTPRKEEVNRTIQKSHPSVNQEQEGEGAIDHPAKTHSDRAHLIDGEIDTGVKSSFKFNGFNFDDSKISANTRKAWDYSHGSASKVPVVTL